MYPHNPDRFLSPVLLVAAGPRPSAGLLLCAIVAPSSSCQQCCFAGSSKPWYTMRLKAACGATSELLCNKPATAEVVDCQIMPDSYSACVLQCSAFPASRQALAILCLHRDGTANELLGAILSKQLSSFARLQNVLIGDFRHALLYFMRFDEAADYTPLQQKCNRHSQSLNDNEATVQFLLHRRSWPEQQTRFLIYTYSKQGWGDIEHSFSWHGPSGPCQSCMSEVHCTQATY